MKITISNRFLKSLFLSFSVVFASELPATEFVVGAIPADVLADYHRFLGDRDPAGLSYYGGEHSRRDVVEVVLIIQALSLGGYKLNLSFLPVESYSRQLIEIKDGRAAIPLTSIWSSDAELLSEQTYLSSTLVKAEDFVAGFYVKSDNLKALSVKNRSQLAKLTAVSNPRWRRDWTVLSSLISESNLHGSVLWPSMVKMVEFGRVDFLLAPFQATADLSLSFEGVRLVPIQGLKVSLGEGRRLIFSKKHPKGQELHEAFEKGFAIMKRNGVIKQAYTESGFYNEAVKDWVMIDET